MAEDDTDEAPHDRSGDRSGDRADGHADETTGGAIDGTSGAAGNEPSGAAGDGPVGETGDRPSDGDGRGTRRRLVILAAAVVLLALVAVGLALRNHPEPQAEPSSTTTTTTLPELQATVVATARNPSVEVLSSPPPEWETARPVQDFEADPAPPEASRTTMPERKAMPTIEEPIQGRYATFNGWRFNNPSPFGDPFVMRVTERRGDWLEVQVPVRPNGTVGYVKASEVNLSDHDQRIEVDLSDRRVRFYDGGELVVETGAVIGSDATRTPTGRFYLTDLVDKDPAGFYGPLALPTSAYSEQLDWFEDGVPVIALHGTNQPELIGQAVSNGCIRLPNEAITEIGRRVQPGIPVDIRA